jgi:hypothetical protein
MLYNKEKLEKWKADIQEERTFWKAREILPQGVGQKSGQDLGKSLLHLYSLEFDLIIPLHSFPCGVGARQ